MVQTDLIIFSLVQAFFVLVLTMLWFKVDRSRDYKDYLTISILIGFPLGLIFDFAGIVLFNLWSIRSTNVASYLTVVTVTYVLAVPLLIETQEYFREKFSKRNTSSYLIKISSLGYSLMLVAGVAALVLLSFDRIDHRTEPAGIGFFVAMFLSVLVISDASLGIMKMKGILTNFFEGKLFVPLSILVSGVLCGFMWELLNKEVRLWDYLNMSGGSFLDVPIVVIFFWGTLNLSYWTAARVIKKLRLIDTN